MQHYLTIFKALYKIKYWYSLLLIKTQLWMLKQTSSTLWMDLVKNTWVVNWSKIVINENKNLNFISFQFILIKIHIFSHIITVTLVYSHNFTVYYFILTLLSKGILLYFHCCIVHAVMQSYLLSNSQIVILQDNNIVIGSLLI